MWRLQNPDAHQYLQNQTYDPAMRGIKGDVLVLCFDPLITQHLESSGVPKGK